MTAPIHIWITCPRCNELHVYGVDARGVDWATKPHHTHTCQGCGLTWRPAKVPTVGVRFLPGFSNEEEEPESPVYAGPCPQEACEEEKGHEGPCTNRCRNKEWCSRPNEHEGSCARWDPDKR